jgi:hypothetical protein
VLSDYSFPGWDCQEAGKYFENSGVFCIPRKVDVMQDIQLVMGGWYIIDAQAVKIHRTYACVPTCSRIPEYENIPFDAMWERKPFEESQCAMYIGYRDVYCGDYVSQEGYDEDSGNWYNEPAEFTRRYTHRVWLFVLNDRQNPIYVFPNDVTEIPY